MPGWVSSWMLVALGLVLAAWAFVDPGFRDSEGFPRPELCLVGSGVLALGILAWGARKKQLEFALWLAIGLVGQAVTLQLVQAGPLVRYQHYHTPSAPIWNAHPFLLLWVSLQAIAIVVAARRRPSGIGHWLKVNLGALRGFAVAIVFFLTSAAVQATAEYYAVDLLFACILQVVNLGTVLMIATTCPRDLMADFARALRTVLNSAADRWWKVDRVALAAAACVGITAALLNVMIYERHPHITDEAAYVFHARVLANGALSVPAPPVPEAFTFYLIDVEGNRLFSVMPPGWPMLLAVGARFGVHWLVNPLLGAVNILLTFSLVRQLYDRRTARIVVAMLCLSPWYVYMAMNFMTHTVTLTCALGATLALLRATRGREMRWAGLAGIITGLASIIRPLDGLILAAFLGFWALWLAARRSLKIAAIVSLLMGTLAGAALLLPYNTALSGTPTAMPVNAYMARYFGHGSNDYGFGPDRGFGWPVDPNPGHSVRDGLINVNLNAFSTNIELLGWSTGSLLLVAFAVFSGRMRRTDYAMVLACALVIGAYFPYYYGGGPDFGARYWYLLIVPCMVLAARGVLLLEDTVTSPLLRGRVMLAVVVLASFAVVNYFPWRALDKYHHSWGMRPDVRTLSARLNFGRSLILVRGPSHPDYASTAVYNPLDYQADVPIYAWDQNPDVRRKLLTAYSDRVVWILNGPTITGRGYEVSEGPVPAQELLARQ